MLRRNRPWLAASLHAFPALLVLYFAARSRRAFLSAIAMIAAVSLAVAELTSGQIFMKWLEVADANSQRFVPKAGNLSVAGLIARFARGMGWPEHVNIVAAALFLRPWNRRTLRPEQLDIEYSVFVTAMLLASPVSWARYLSIMLLPMAVLIRNWRLRRPTWAAAALLAVLFFMSSSENGFPGRLAGDGAAVILDHGDPAVAPLDRGFGESASYSSRFRIVLRRRPPLQPCARTPRHSDLHSILHAPVRSLPRPSVAAVPCLRAAA
jgi:hypothetical protein